MQQLLLLLEHLLTFYCNNFVKGCPARMMMMIWDIKPARHFLHVNFSGNRIFVKLKRCVALAGGRTSSSHGLIPKKKRQKDERKSGCLPGYMSFGVLDDAVFAACSGTAPTSKSANHSARICIHYAYHMCTPAVVIGSLMYHCTAAQDMGCRTFCIVGNV